MAAGASQWQDSLQLSGFYGDLGAGAPIDLRGMLPELAGVWNVTRVEHRLGETLVTSMDAEREEKEER